MRSVLVIMALLMILVPKSRAQSPSEWFSVSDINVNTLADNAVIAKEQAIAQAQVSAFSSLMARLVPQFQQGQIPAVNGADYVSDFSVERERVDGQRYIATMTVRFVPSAIRNLLNSAGITLQEQPRSAHTLLIVPVWQLSGQPPLIWEGINPWKGFWKASTTPEVSMILAKGNDDDRYLLPTSQASNENPSYLQALGAHYQTTKVMAVIATPEDNGNRIDVKLIATPGTAKPFISMSYPRREGETPNGLVKRVANLLSQSIIESYQNTGQNGGSELYSSGFKSGLVTGSMVKRPVLIGLDGLADWIKLRSLLSQISILQGWDVVSLSRNMVALSLNLRGDETQLIQALMGLGFTINQSSTEESWTLILPVADINPVPTVNQSTSQAVMEHSDPISSVSGFQPMEE